MNCFKDKYTVVVWSVEMGNFHMERFNAWSSVKVAQAYATHRKLSIDNYIIIKTQDLDRVNKPDADWYNDIMVWP